MDRDFYLVDSVFQPSNSHGQLDSIAAFLGGSKRFSYIFNTNSLRDRYYRTVSFVSMTIISNKCPFIVQQVLIIFMP